PEATRQEVAFLQDTLLFLGRPGRQEEAVTAHLTAIRKAIRRCEALRLSYHARHGEPGTRDVEPHGLISVGGLWMLAAYCRTRQEMRHFRLDRIDALTPLG